MSLLPTARGRSGEPTSASAGCREDARARATPGPASRNRRWIALLLGSSLACGRGAVEGAPRPGPAGGPAAGLAAASTAGQAARAEGGVPASSGTQVSLEASRASILAAFRARRFEEIESLLSRLAAEAAADPARHELQADNAFAAFSTALPELEPLFDEWVVARRGSAVALQARARYLAARGWRARGERWAAETPDASFVEMRRWNDRASIDAWSAVRERGDLIDGWTLLVNLSLGQPRQCVKVADQGLAAVPASFRIRAALLNCLTPRWGGNYETMRTIARDAQTEAGRNPNLRWLLGFEPDDRADMALSRGEVDEAERWVAQATAQGGDYWRIRLTEVRVKVERGQATEALAAVEQALAGRPEEPDLLEQQIYLLSRLGREEETRRAIAHLASVDPGSSYLAASRSRLAREASKACETLSRNGAFREAVERCGEALASDPGDAGASFWLGRAHLKLDDELSAQAAFEAALRADPRSREAIVNLDYLYAKRGEWDRIVALWDAYLTLEPGDAKALLERAGTHRHRGDMPAACRDLRRSCELGNPQACQLARGNC